MRGERLEVKHRVKGRPAIIRSTRGLLLRVHRFGRARAVTSADLHWAARAIDALDRALRVMEEPAIAQQPAPRGPRAIGQGWAAPPSSEWGDAARAADDKERR